ncbi:MAG: 1-acyl-sn-glycerol-3-phosphate acyltransferase [Candidatus Marinimicrobia bacterium]|nr:1-acyl-sn-glycerol-3-phosphate acyltransferase [Candidatus Neomarinimicrobiota bacterium]
MFILRSLVSIFFYTTALFTFIIFGTIFIILGLFPNAVMFAYIPFFCRILLLSLGVIIRVHGEFPKNGPYILMFNHGSFIDPFVYAAMIKGKFTAVIAAENYKIPIFSSILRKFRAIPIHRKNRKKAMESIKYAESVIKNEGYHMAILPEGTRTLNGKLKQFKKGGFHMAINTNTPILPIGAVLPFKYKPKNRWYVHPCIIDMYIGEETDVNEYDQLGVSGLLEKVENQIENLISKKGS